MPHTAPAPQPSLWRYFPHAMLAALGLVVLVNGGMIWAALHTFPGVAATDVFDHSNRYDEVLDEARREAGFGWTVQADMRGAAVTLTLTDRAGQALAGARVVAEARRPVGPDQAAGLAFAETAPGRYAAAAALPAPGQWDLRLTVARGTDVLHATRRVLVK